MSGESAPATSAAKSHGNFRLMERGDHARARFRAAEDQVERKDRDGDLEGGEEGFLHAGRVSGGAVMER